jgi:hypothetical protein
MNPRTVRIKKEVRALLWPWCAVVIAGAAPIVLPHSYAEPLSFMSFFFGTTLLATLSLGDEFRHRTLSLWLSQPMSRIELWAEKTMVMCAAVLSAGLLNMWVMFSVTWPDLRVTYRVAAIAYVIFVMASATFWILAVRSTLGSLALFSCILFGGSLFSGGNADLRVATQVAAIAVISILTICFAPLTLWLGARKLARFQVTGASADNDMLTTGPALAPEFMVKLFRCRPSGAFLNLIRKEFRLVRPLWLIGLLVVLYTACLAMLRLFPSPPVREPRTVVEWALLGPLVSICIAVAGLAGILSVGEEKTSGTHAWHMTLPISTRRQWLIKLLMAMFAGIACAVVFPVLTMIAGGAVWGSPFMFVDPQSLPNVLGIFAVLTFSCFWCACAANGTVRAAIWAFPVMAAVALSAAGGIRLGRELAGTTGTLKEFIVSSLHLSPLAFANLSEAGREGVLWLFVPALLFALIQSYRLFRTPAQDSALWMLQRMMATVVITLLWSFSAYAGFVSSRWDPFDETRQALDKLQRGTSKAQFAGKDLANGVSLTASTQRWLRGSTITVAPDHAHLAGYVATIHLAGGLECKLTATHYGGTAASCGT